MHPALSVILFTVLSGAGFGFLAMLGLGVTRPTGVGALLPFGLAYALAVAGLLASTFHLGNPQRALRAFSQWRTSWLSREGWASMAALLAGLPVVWRAVGGQGPGVWGPVLAVVCGLTVLSTAMIYAQLRTVPRWNHWITPLLFFAFALAGGSILAATGWPVALVCLALGGVMVLAFRLGDAQFAARGQSLASATGLGSGGIWVFAPAHTAANYVRKEMVFTVGRKHARKLRIIAILFASVLPALLLAAAPAGLPAALVAFALHLTGALAQRWLFFAEAEHVVSHYYGRGGQ